MEPFEALSLCGEIAIAITGFSGVVLVFGGRGGDAWDEVDRVRFRILFTGTLVPLSLIALSSVLASSQMDHTSVWRTCSVFYLVTSSTTAFLNVRAAARASSGDPDLQVPRFANVWRGGAVALAIAMLVIALQLANAVSIQSFWPVLVAVWWSIALSLFAFVGLVFPARAA